MKQETIKRLQNFYMSMCNGDWEHTYGIKIDNIDNPGWAIEVDLYDSYLQEMPFKKIKNQREIECDWYFCEVKDHKFSGCCGPENLDEVITIFLDWAEKMWEEYQKQ